MSATNEAENDEEQPDALTRLRQGYNRATEVFYERVVRVVFRSIWNPVLIFGVLLTVFGWVRSPGETSAVAGLLGLTLIAMGGVGIIGLWILRRI